MGVQLLSAVPAGGTAVSSSCGLPILVLMFLATSAELPIDRANAGITATASGPVNSHPGLTTCFPRKKLARQSRSNALNTGSGPKSQTLHALLRRPTPASWE